MRRRVSAVACAFAAVPLLGGCGIQETDVIEAGGPATVQAFINREYDMLLFFRTPDGGVIPVFRETVSSRGFGGEYVEAGAEDRAGAVPTEKVVMALLGGPAKEDRAAGLGTSLPTARPGGTVEVEPSSGGRVTIRLPFALEGLDGTALRQLTCTIAYSEDVDGQVVVELTGQDGASNSATCGLTPGSTGDTPAETETETETETGARPTTSGTTG